MLFYSIHYQRDLNILGISNSFYSEVPRYQYIQSKFLSLAFPVISLFLGLTHASEVKAFNI
ncbi:hypothetical protein CC78DRAFT_164738 [Lojkania enalia]|uniref:Uncharacterized protein n=1 Tax=Lojkania enalia TaxID=147567 RepID=A0A9P4KGN3_9PLEO|nr:hypothetical protein CC78DRAFT_164738 [Didymosphaeria enalia]